VNLGLLPLYGKAASTATREAILATETTLTNGVRKRAARWIGVALRRGTVSPSQVETAAMLGDEGIAALMRGNVAPILAPRIDSTNVPSVPEKAPSQKVIAALHPWVHMLAKEGHLSDLASAELATGHLTKARVYRVLMSAWQRKVSAALASIALPQTLLEGDVPTFDVIPQSFAALIEGRVERDLANRPALIVRTRSVSHVPLRARGDDFLAIAGALQGLSKVMDLPLISDSRYVVEEIYPPMDELCSDLEEIAVWDEAGTPSFPLDQLIQMAENFGYDDFEPDQIEEFVQHLKWRRVRNETTPWEVHSTLADAWLETRGDCAVTQCHRELRRLTTLLTGRVPHMPYECEGYPSVMVTVVPTGTGFDDWIEQCINDLYNNGDSDGDAVVSLPAKAAQLGSRCDRALIEVAVANYVASLIENLDYPDTP